MLDPGDAPLDLKVKTDFIPEQWSVSGTVTGPLQLIEDGAANLSGVKGKIAVEVDDKITSDDPEFPANATEEKRLQDAGATAVIILQSPSDLGRGRLGVSGDSACCAG